MVKVAFVRGAYLNNFEGQNYVFDSTVSMNGFSSLTPIHSRLPFPVTRLVSPADFPLWKRYVRYIANRTIGDSQVLFNLERIAGKYDIYHTADPHYYYSFQLARLRRAGKIKRLLCTSWETIPHNNESVQPKRRLKQFVLSMADHFLCYTEKAKNCLMQEGVKQNRITVIPLGVDLSVFRRKLPTPKKDTIYLFAGRLVPEKGVWDVYNSFKNLKKTDIYLRIVGEGPLKNELLRKVHSDKLENRVRIEVRDYRNMPEAFRDADVFVLPSKKTPTWEEQYGMVLVEALATGIPVVAYDTGAIPEVVGKGGLIVGENNTQALTDCMERLADVQLRVKIGTIGRERAETTFDAQNTADKIASLYKYLMKP